VKKLHGVGIIHGDLTTSNMIYANGDIYLLDFGLGALTATVEDKAVDLFLFEKAFIATHPHLEEKFKRVLEEYGEISVIQRL
jgi:TP53 regulating kinase-like protein